MNRTKRKKIALTWRTRRERLGISLEDFAAAHRFGKGQLSRWERGIWVPSESSVERMQTALRTARSQTYPQAK